MDAVEVSSADIARIANVRPTAVSNWRKRHIDFPEPVGGTEKSPRFNLSDVLSWLRDQGKAVNLPTQQRLHQAIESAAEHTSLPAALVQAGLALLYVDHPPPGANADAWIDPLAEAQAELARTNFGLADVPPPDALAPASNAMLRTALTEDNKRSRQSIVEKLLDRYLQDRPPSNLGTTPRPLAELMIALVGSDPGSLMDPACGTGSILVSAAKAGHSRLMGQDADPTLAMMTAIRLQLTGTQGFDIQLGDALNRDAFGSAKADNIACHVPPSDRGWLRESSLNDERWAYGVPSNRESELAWVQHALWHLKPGGMAALLMSPGAGTRPSGRRIRRELASKGALRAVISLPRGSLHNTTVAPQVWLLTNAASVNAHSTVLMMDLSNQHEDNVPQWKEISERALGCWHRYQESWSDRLRRNDQARAVPIIELLDEEVDLTPTKYLPVTLAPAKSVIELKEEHRKATLHFEGLQAQLAELPIEFTNLPTTIRWETIDLLEQQDVLRIWRHQTSGDSSHSTKLVRVITPIDIARHQASQESTEVPDVELATQVRPGDVLAVVINRRLYARTATDADIDAHIGPQVVILRPHPQMLDCHYLSGFLNGRSAGEQLARNISSTGVHTTSELRRIRMPVPDIDAQIELAKRLCQLEQLADHARSTFRLTDVFTGDYRDSLLEQMTGEDMTGEDRSGQTDNPASRSTADSTEQTPALADDCSPEVQTDDSIVRTHTGQS
ncbi:type I restriction-modification system DNA methylase subunit [Stackebrandtia endophytica]|uniref:Type I restriction-modification system DNA methylase subunit n=1 Tax=Stackebrandtia endophytica TaxID=1496996 RepID=A0A543ARD1_9ACTN|nr:N-6 DNA methylase [Stackebrandtia endophytica]TQL75148.1 type I restriction-modification system DNA methylase subunit [Stackebrandtia endophytica]